MGICKAIMISDGHPQEMQRFCNVHSVALVQTQQ